MPSTSMYIVVSHCPTLAFTPKSASTPPSMEFITVCVSDPSAHAKTTIAKST